MCSAHAAVGGWAPGDLWGCLHCPSHPGGKNSNSSASHGGKISKNRKTKKNNQNPAHQIARPNRAAVQYSISLAAARLLQVHRSELCNSIRRCAGVSNACHCTTSSKTEAINHNIMMFLASLNFFSRQLHRCSQLPITLSCQPGLIPLFCDDLHLSPLSAAVSVALPLSMTILELTVLSTNCDQAVHSH